MAENKILPGSTEKLGATYDGKGVNFALFSENATKVELCLFDENDNETRIELPHRSEDGVWSGYLPDANRECVTDTVSTGRMIPTAVCVLIRTSC